jgi:hypothetical protein
MNWLLSQSASSAPETVLERIPSGDLTGMIIVGIVFLSILLIVVAVSVTRTVQSICIASANSRMAERLAQQGMAPDQIERLVRANWSGRRCRERDGERNVRSAWRQAATMPPHAGKPV